MNAPDTLTKQPGQHIGDLPEDPATLADIQRMNARGWYTTTTSTYEAMQAAGIEPAGMREIGGLA